MFRLVIRIAQERVAEAYNVAVASAVAAGSNDAAALLREMVAEVTTLWHIRQ